MGIDSPLVDNEGYPRADIDVYRARTLRKRFHEIQNDHKALVHKIDMGLVEITALTVCQSVVLSLRIIPTLTYCTNLIPIFQKSTEDEEETKARLAPKPKPKFDPHTGKWVVKSWDGSVAGVVNGESRQFDDLSARVSGDAVRALSSFPSATDRSGNGINLAATAASNSTGIAREEQNHVSFQEPITPFAIIDEVFSNSPAHEAGLKEGDVLLRFGSVNSTNHRDFRAIAELVPVLAGEGKSVPITVRRKQNVEWGEVVEVKTLDLKPRPWEGRGLLGCHINKYTE